MRIKKELSAKIYNNRWGIIYIVIVAIFLICYFPAFNKSLWNDEVYATHHYAMNGIYGVFTTPYVATNHPFYSLLEAIMISIFSFSELVARIPAIIFGLIFLLVLYYYNSKYFGNMVAFGVGILMLVNDNFASLFFQARGYTIVYLCATIVIFSCYEWIENRKNGYTFLCASAVGIWTWPLFCVLVGFLLLYVLCIVEGKRKKEVIKIGGGSILASLIFYLPMIKSMFLFYSQGMDVFGEKLSWNNVLMYNFYNLMSALGINEDCRLGGMIVLFAWIIGIYLMTQKCSELSRYLIAACFGYSISVLILGLNTNPRYFVLLDEVTLIFIVYGLQQMFMQKNRILKIGLIVLMILMIFDNNYTKNHEVEKRLKEIRYPREAYKETAEYIVDKLADEASSVKVVVCTQRSYGFEFYFEIFGVNDYEVVVETDNSKILDLLEKWNDEEKVILVDHVFRRDAIAEFENNMQYDFSQMQYSRGYMKVYIFEKGYIKDVVDSSD